MKQKNKTILIQPIPVRHELVVLEESFQSARPKGVQILDWRLFHLMYDRFFRYDKPCFMSAERLAYILTSGISTAASIRNSRCRLKKAGLISVQNIQSDFSNKTIAYCFITDKGKKIVEKKKSTIDSVIEPEKTIVSNTISAKVNNNDKKYSLFDYRVSRRYSKRIQRAYPMKSNSVWNEEWAETLRKLREIDGFTEKEIEDTIDFIMSDNQPRNGFCYAKVLRSPLQFRTKWNNGLTKFCNAYEQMKAQKLSNPDIDDEDSLPYALREMTGENNQCYRRKIFDPPRDLTSENQIDLKISRFFEELLWFPHPSWKLNSQNFLQYEQYCFDLALFFEELILDRGWDSQIIDQFMEVQKVDNKNLKFYTLDILREKTLTFFKERVEKFFKLSIGKFNQIRKHYITKEDIVMYDYDSDFLERVENFVEDQKNLEPFKRATVIYDDSEVEMDYEYNKYEKGTFNQ